MTNKNRIAGVIGGMGPEATVDFMAKVIAFTEAEIDQDHVQMLVEHNPKIPSRHAALFGDGEDPVPVLAAMAARLEAGGANFLVMPCNFAHAFQEQIETATKIPLISIIDETVAEIRDKFSDVTSVGILAAQGCVHSGIYQAALEKNSLSPVMQTDSELAKLMTLINAIKGGQRTEQITSDMLNLAEALIQRGAQLIVAACTELPLVLESTMLRVPLVSSTDVLARKTILLAKGEIPLPD
jgi:aspartate racemase